MKKGDVIGWAAILGGVALLGYLGYRGVKSLFPGGFGSTTTFGGEEVETDIFGNIPGSTQQEVIDERVTALSEQSAKVTAGLNLIDTYDYGPRLENAYRDYEKELREYEAAASIYQAMHHWDWLGRVTPESQAQYAKMHKEYQEALAAHQVYSDIRVEWMAQNA